MWNIVEECGCFVEKCGCCMDGWMSRVLRPFNSIPVIWRRWGDEHERLCAMKRRLGSGRISPPAGFEPTTVDVMWTLHISQFDQVLSPTLSVILKYAILDVLWTFHISRLYSFLSFTSSRVKLIVRGVD